MHLFMDVIVAVMGLVVVAQFVWGMRYHFKTERLPLASKAISTIGTAAVVLFLALQFSRVQPLGAQFVGLALAVAASVLFTASVRASRHTELYYVFEGRSPQQILQAGPYRHVRHPFYVSYLLLWAGWALATWSPVAFLPVIALVLLYVRAALGEERAIMASSLAGQYADYKRRTGFFWPRLGGRLPGAWLTPQK